ncbi:MAG: radical SAM protein [Tannerella sp.]|jgi:radical SAM protein with 4Fe4S-binding SPASM domain|nr:radical SAM protein [Tannerella sp.]
MYKLSSDIVDIGEYFLNKRTGEAFQLDGKIRAILSKHNFDDDLLLAENKKLHKFLLKNGIIANNIYDEKKDFFHIQWHLLNGCNLRCKHCYDWKETTAPLSLKQMFKVVDDYVYFLKKMDFQGEISLTGGEPTLFKQLLELIEYIKTREVFISLYILSNGVDFPENLIEVLLKYNIGVQISVDGLEQVHDEIRGNGNYAKSIFTLGKLMTAGVKTAVHFVIMKRNKDDILGFIRYMNSLGVSRINFSTLVPIGPGAQEETVSKLELKKCFESIKQIQEEVNTVVIGQRPLWVLLGYEGVCPVGFKTLTLDACGNFMPCRRLPIVIGNTLEDSWFDIWFNSEFLQKMRDRENNIKVCGKCSKADKCGGCRAMAMATTGDPFEHDYYCWYNEE